MAAPNVNGRLHLTGVPQKPPASFQVCDKLFSRILVVKDFVEVKGTQFYNVCYPIYTLAYKYELRTIKNKITLIL